MTPQPTPRRTRSVRACIVVLLVALLATACGASSSTNEIVEPTPLPGPPDALAFSQEEIEPAVVVMSDDYCIALSNIWVHAAALDIAGSSATPEMNRIALANIGEWIELATLAGTRGEAKGDDRTPMLDAFNELRTSVARDDANWHSFDWQAFVTAEADQSEAGEIYTDERGVIAHLVATECDRSVVDMLAEADERATEMVTDFGLAPASITESDSLPGHSIFTHPTGRLIASFPTAWSHEERRTGPAIVDFVAAPDVERFLRGDAIDGVHLQLVEADTLDDFRTLIDSLALLPSTCLRSSEEMTETATRVEITQVFGCSDHSGSIIAQYNQTRMIGLIIEASFDSTSASQADLTRLSSIANSALWS